MSMTMRPTHMAVSKGAYRRNYEAFATELAKRGSKMMCTVKADGYGMGMVQVSRWFAEWGADYFSVATPDEAEVMRQAGFTQPILVLGVSPYDAAEFYVKEDVRCAMTDYAFAQKLSEAAVKMGKTAKVHIKVDTGMGRIGFLMDRFPEIAMKIAALPGIEIEGMFTHFSTSDETDLSWTHEQFKKFSAVVKAVRDKGIKVKYLHTCNSAAIMAGLQDYYCDYGRPGHALHGLNPSGECGHAVKIEPVFALKTQVALIRDLPRDWPVSYGRTYYSGEGERTAVLPIGYADGLPRLLSNNADVLIRGQRCPLRGRICMDQCMVSVGHLPEVAIGDEVVFVGKQGNEEITADEYAAKAGVITGVVTTTLTKRVPRVYVEEL